MNILILGSGGREHAFAWKIAQSPLCEKLYVAPGNGGTSEIAENVPIQVNEFEAIGAFCLEKNISLVLVGPEDPLVKGISDYFESTAALKKIAIIGPTAAGAKLEGSKDFAKQFMIRHGVPTAAYKTFTAGNIEEAYAFIDKLNAPYVLKADGLAAGKGVVISPDKESAKAELKSMLLDSKFGAASASVVIEEFLHGIELSVFVLTDGEHYLLLPSAKDYKRIGEGDTGLNTGGMGAISPVPFASDEFINKVEERIVKPSIAGLKKDSIRYRGFIFIGLMNCGGDPYVIEYNVRMGDPETEAVMPRIKNDFVELLKAVADGNLNRHKLDLDPRSAAVVVIASGGYPEAFEKGKQITIQASNSSILFHAGTQVKDGQLLSSGGRVFAVCSLAENIEKAVDLSLKTADSVSFDKKYYRKDIGKDLLAVR